MELILIRPLGFAIDDTNVARSGTRYWKYVNLNQYDNWGHFIDQNRPKKEEIFFFEETGETSFYDAQYPRNAYLVFGCESKGLPKSIRKTMNDRIFSLPMKNETVKSLNLANAATAVVYQAMRDYLKK